VKILSQDKNRDSECPHEFNRTARPVTERSHSIIFINVVESAVCEKGDPFKAMVRKFQPQAPPLGPLCLVTRQ
jgi:hypothetical protein